MKTVIALYPAENTQGEIIVAMEVKDSQVKELEARMKQLGAFKTQVRSVSSLSPFGSSHFSPSKQYTFKNQAQSKKIKVKPQAAVKNI